MAALIRPTGVACAPGSCSTTNPAGVALTSATASPGYLTCMVIENDGIALSSRRLSPIGVYCNVERDINGDVGVHHCANEGAVATVSDSSPIGQQSAEAICPALQGMPRGVRLPGSKVVHLAAVISRPDGVFRVRMMPLEGRAMPIALRWNEIIEGADAARRITRFAQPECIISSAPKQHRLTLD
ncbi:hypothetical protein DC522_14290 [Microvirga sp. KLBC 81]|nr:hypothetical protein DC522_14290 [Microvirga sp. KLBC 81]